MKTLQEAIKEHLPCEVCGNKDVAKFTLRGTIRDGQKSRMIMCDVCNEVYSVEEGDEL